MKKKLVLVGKKLTWFVREIGNLIANLFVPAVSLVCALAELFQLPANVIEGIKKFEYWLFKISGTLPHIEKVTKEVVDKLEEDPK